MSVRSLRRLAVFAAALALPFSASAATAAAQSRATRRSRSASATTSPAVRRRSSSSATSAARRPTARRSTSTRRRMRSTTANLTGVVGADPQIDRDPTRRVHAVRRRVRERTSRSSSAQITGLGDELVGNAADPGIVQVDTEHFGPIGLADPADPNSDALVVLAYNIVDGVVLRLRRDAVHGRLLRAASSSTRTA